MPKPRTGRVPPSDAARIELFFAQVEIYRELAEALPVEQKTYSALPPRPPADHWHRLLRSFALRKFVAFNDQVYLPTVADSVTALLPPGYPDDFNRENAEESISFWSTRGTFYQVDRTATTADVIIKDLMYGQYLHGDYGRWEASRNQQRHDDHALWLWTSGIEALVYAADIHMRKLCESGLIGLVPPAKELQTGGGLGRPPPSSLL